MFAKPFPAFSNQMNAWVTMLTCQWLMGPSKVNDIEREDGTIAKNSGVLVERCGEQTRAAHTSSPNLVRVCWGICLQRIEYMYYLGSFDDRWSFERWTCLLER
jgi:hypothetical protein